MSGHAIDYFVTLGRSPGPVQCRSFPVRLDDDSEPLSAKDAWQEAITDIILLGPGEELPDEDSWSFLTETYNGNPVEPPYIAFRKRIFSHRVDHICQIKYVAPGEVVPPGFELLRSTASGKGSGYIKPYGFLAIKRAPTDSSVMISGHDLIYDICIVKSSLKEDVPEHYYQIEKDSTGTMAAFTSHDIIIALRKLPPMGVCDLGFAASPLDRYPLKDDAQSPLPSEALPVFAFPQHLRMIRSRRNEYPLPVFFTFVFTDQDGRHLYAACLKFFEVLPTELFVPIVKEIYGDEAFVELPEDEAIFCPKAICVLARKPFYRAMRRYLRHIYSLSLSSAMCPLEHYISTVVQQVPLPVEGGRPFHVVLDAALISVYSKPMSPIIFSLPPPRFFPSMDLDFAGPLRCLSIDAMLAVYTLMLREAKMVFLSCSNTLLTETMETLRMLLFPMTWSSCFVSRLPLSLHGLLQAPGGLMIGVHVERSTQATSSSVQDVRKFISEMHHHYPLVTGTYVIDLTSGTICQFTGHRVEKLQAYEQDNILRTLPPGPKLRLKAKLHKIAEEYRIAPQTVGLEEFDSAFDLQSSEDDAIPREKWDEFPTLELRDSFMSFMIDLLGNYHRYIIPPVEDMLAESYRTFKEEFSVEEYLSAADPSCRPILDFLMETQMFSVLLQSRSEGNAEAVVFFEQAAELQHELGLSAGGHGAGTPKCPYGTCELPLPIYELLSKENQWSALTKIMQQQIIATRDVKKAHRINALSTSSLSPMRGTGGAFVVNYSPVPVTTTAISDLLLLNDFTYCVPQHHLDNESESPYYYVARKELDRAEDLHLGKEDFGPLIIGGPTTNGTMDCLVREDGEAEGYVYKSWPDLQHSVLVEGEALVHPRITQIREARVDEVSKVNSSLCRMVRSPVERMASVGNQLSTKNGKLNIHADVIPMLSAIVDVTSVSITMLVMRILNNVQPSHDMLQVLGIIAEIERVNLLPSLNESVWRSIIMACGAVGGHIMRRIAHVVFQCMEAARGTNANAITFGRYVQALGAKKLNMPEPVADLVDQFVFLEEVGFTWYVQKTALTTQNQIINLEERKLAGSEHSSKSKKVALASVNTEAARVVAAKLGLQFNPGFLPFMKPAQFSAMALPQPLGLVASVQNSEFVAIRARAYLDQLSAACMPSVRTYAPPSPIKPHDAAKKAHKDTHTPPASTPERLTSMISFNTSATLQAVSKMGSSWLARSVPTIKASGESQSSRPAPPTVSSGSTSTPASTKAALPSTSSWRSFFGGRSPGPNVSSPAPTMPSVPEASSLAASGMGLREGEAPRSSLDQLASTLAFDDEEGSHGEENDSASEGSHQDDGVPLTAPGTSDSVLLAAPESTAGRRSSKTHVLQEMSLGAHSAVESGLSTVVDDIPEAAEAEVEATTERVSEDSGRPKSTSSVSTGAAAEANIIGELNDKVLECFTQHFMDSGAVASLHSETPCSCGFVLLDEEILGLWCRSASIDIHGADSASAKASKRRKSTIMLDPFHRILCPSCGKEVNPKLHVTRYERQRAAHDDHPLAVAAAGDEIEVKSMPVEEVNYMSPFVLRVEMEEAILKIGERLADADALHAHSPHLFWNIVWYAQRFSLPSGFFSAALCRGTKSDSQGAPAHRLPVVIGWGQAAVRAKCKRVLQGVPGDMLEARDILPFLSELDLKVVTDEVLAHLDSSPAGMRQALLALSKCASLFEHAQAHGVPVARVLYTSLLSLALHFAHFTVYDRRKAGSYRDVAHDCVFDKIFLDCVKCVLNPEDFAALHVDQLALEEAAKNRTANIVRSVFNIIA